MPKQEVGSTKWLGNKMKAKGLQKLRWYCQMCQKQCRDENGFKCHRMSDGHQRQMQIFVQDPNRFMDEYSQEFQEGFMHLMSHRYRSTRILANSVYCEFIADRHHTHMNATIWVTLSNFVQYLGRTNQCKIDKTPKGWYLEYVDNSAEAKLREAEKERLITAELAETDAHERRLQKAVEEGKAAGGFQESEFTELQRKEGDAPIAFALAGEAADTPAKPSTTIAAKASGGNVLADAFQARAKASKEKEGRKLSALESVRLEHEAAKKKTKVEAAAALPSSPESSGPWLTPGIIVKVMHPELSGGKYHKKKGKVEKVHDRYAADIRMLDSKDLLRIDQEMLETVIPNIGKSIKIVKGSYRGRQGKLKAVDFHSFSVTVVLEDGTEIEGMGYDEICKIEE